MTSAARLATTAVVMTSALLMPVTFWNGGILEVEATSFIAWYTADRPVLAKIFDPHLNDFDSYQARELSYAIDLVDAQFYAFVARVFDRVLLVPLSALVASAVMAGVFLSGVRRTMPGITPLVATLLSACLISSFQFVSTMGTFYRSGKPLLAVVVLTFLFHVRRVEQARHHPPSRWLTFEGAVAGVLCLVGGLLDRQGVVYVLIACAVLGLHYRFTRRMGDVLAASCAAALLLIAYGLLLAPALVLTLNGYWPDFSYQTRALRSSLSLWRPGAIAASLELLAANAGTFLGGLPSLGLPLAVAVGAMVWTRLRRAARGSGWTAVAHHLAHNAAGRMLMYGALVLGAQVIMFAVMIRQHPPIQEWVDHRYWYYPLPYVVTLLFALALWIHGLAGRANPPRQRLIAAALVAVVAANVAGLSRHRAAMTSGPWFAVVHAQSALLKSSLRSGTPDPRLDANYREFFDLDRRLRTGDRRPAP